MPSDNNTLHELPIPVDIEGCGRAYELVRVWGASGKQHVSLAIGLWEDLANWGIMLADLARHIANAYCETEGADRAQAMHRIRQGFDAEWDSPTDKPTGRVD